MGQDSRFYDKIGPRYTGDYIMEVVGKMMGEHEQQTGTATLRQRFFVDEYKEEISSINSSLECNLSTLWKLFGSW